MTQDIMNRVSQWDGLYLMPVNQVTGELLTPDEVHEIVAYLGNRQAAADTLFDIAVHSATPSDAAEGATIVSPYRDARAT